MALNFGVNSVGTIWHFGSSCRQVRRTRFTVTGENVANMVGATSSEGFLVLQLRSAILFSNDMSDSEYTTRLFIQRLHYVSRHGHLELAGVQWLLVAFLPIFQHFRISNDFLTPVHLLHRE